MPVDELTRTPRFTSNLVPQSCSLSPSDGSIVFPDQQIEFTGVMWNDSSETGDADALFAVNGEQFDSVHHTGINSFERVTDTVTVTPQDLGYSGGDVLNFEYGTFDFDLSALASTALQCGSLEVAGSGSGDFDPNAVTISECAGNMIVAPGEGFRVDVGVTNNNDQAATLDLIFTADGQQLQQDAATVQANDTRTLSTFISQAPTSTGSYTLSAEVTNASPA